MTPGCVGGAVQAHAVVHISGFGHFKARTILFTVAWLAFMTYAVVLLQRAM